MKLCDILREELVRDGTPPAMIEKLLVHTARIYPVVHDQIIPPDQIEQYRNQFRGWLRISKILPIEVVKNAVNEIETKHRIEQN